MRLFIDECLSPQIARELNASGEHVAEHPLDFGGRGAPDHRVLQRCIARGLVIVTENARDFRALVGVEAFTLNQGRRSVETINLFVSQEG